MEATNGHPTRLCQVCGLAVGTYEPAVFMLGAEMIHSSRAALPGVAGRAGSHVQHEACFAEHAGASHLNAA